MCNCVPTQQLKFMKTKKPYCKDIHERYSWKTSSAVRLSLYFPAFAGKYLKTLYFAPPPPKGFAFIAMFFYCVKFRIS